MITIAALCVVVSVSLLQGSTWKDPTFEEMVRTAELVAVVEVLAGGPFECTVQVLDAVKGEAPPNAIRVTGYNNEHWPPHGVDEETLDTGQKLLMFLVEGESSGDERSDPAQKLWFTPTPSTGDYRIEERIDDRRIRGSWYDTSYPDTSAAVDLAIVLALVRGLVRHQAGGHGQARADD